MLFFRTISILIPILRKTHRKIKNKQTKKNKNKKTKTKKQKQKNREEGPLFYVAASNPNTEILQYDWFINDRIFPVLPVQGGI